jgi:hypothetical protein
MEVAKLEIDYKGTKVPLSTFRPSFLPSARPSALPSFAYVLFISCLSVLLVYLLPFFLPPNYLRSIEAPSLTTAPKIGATR